MIKSKITHPDGVVSYKVDMEQGEAWWRFNRALTKDEERMFTFVAQVGSVEAVLALELPIWEPEWPEKRKEAKACFRYDKE